MVRLKRRRSEILRRGVRIAILTILFMAYSGLAIIFIRTPEKSNQDRLIWIGFAISFLYFWAYWRFWKEDVLRFGKPDIWVRVVCYINSVFFCLGIVFSLLYFSVQV